ncbi:flagellar protein FlaG [Kushneria aurantia]|uniref:Flagellar protein FlaG n=1 Tax=Kushneria aurantia TaxID=504092 RepID=A0ABV6G136_9GAMM|nr:flagellar protein FlaG [Kushneria aurantia]
MNVENNVELAPISALWPKQDTTTRAQTPLLTLPPGESTLPARASESPGTMSPDAIRDTVERLNQEMIRRGIEFDIHDDSGRIVTRVVDRDSGELIRQIPAEEMLEVARRLDDDQGLLEIQA